MKAENKDYVFWCGIHWQFRYSHAAFPHLEYEYYLEGCFGQLFTYLSSVLQAKGF